MAVNLLDYSRTAAQRGWGAGWPSCGGAKNNLATITFKKTGVRITVHKRIARLVTLLADETEKRGYSAKSGQTGAYNCRAIGGTNSPSNHSWGLAIDWNWTDNPFTTNAALNHVPAWMPTLWNRYGFAWGGHYTGKKDFMHWEFMGTPADADAMTDLALRELTAQEANDMAQVPQNEWDAVRNMILRSETAWPGGVTDDQNRPYDAFMFAKRANVETRWGNTMLTRVLNDNAALHQKVDDLNERLSTLLQALGTQSGV